MIPDYQTLMLPVLVAASDREVNTRDVIEVLADKFGLSNEEREQLLPSGKQRTFDNRVHWAKSYLKQAGLVRYPVRNCYVVTDVGRDVLAKDPNKIDRNFLQQFDAFQDFQNRKGTKVKSGLADVVVGDVDRGETLSDSAKLGGGPRSGFLERHLRLGLEQNHVFVWERNSVSRQHA